MISAVREIGMLSLKMSGKDVLSTLIETINQNKYPNMLVIELEDDEQFGFLKIDLEETNAIGYEKYLYRKGAPNGANFSPTAIITEPEKTLQVKIIGWFKSIEKFDINPAELKFFKAIRATLENQQQNILSSLKMKMKDLKGSAGITLKLGGRYLQELPIFRNAFLQQVMAKEDNISALDKTCSVCGQRKVKVSGGSPAYKFYTIDKPGSITGHFIKENSWRNFPVCSECSLALDEGKRVVEENFKFSFYGLPYYLIPKFILGEPSPVVLSIIAGKMEKSIKLNANSGIKLTNYEDDILAHLAEEKDTMTLQFLFLRSQQGAERILLLVEDILPSRLRHLFMAKEKVDRIFPGSPFHLGCIRTFFSKSDEGKRDNDLDKYFLEIIDRIFKDISVSMQFLTIHFMREIRRDFNVGEKSFYKAMSKVAEAMKSVEFFSRLKMLGGKEVKMSMSLFDSVFERYGAQLDTPEKKGIFLLGSFARMLLNVQYVERKTQPFLTQLMGLKMDAKHVKGLLAKVENKFREYERFDKGKAQLAESIARFFMESSPAWRLTVDEINFYFVCGMNLYNEVNMVIYGKKEEEANYVVE